MNQAAIQKRLLLKRERDTKREAGVCIASGCERPAAPGRANCEACLAANRERSKAHKERKAEMGICWDCWEEATEGLRCAKCAEKRRARGKAART